jgi:hypothetical protein
VNEELANKQAEDVDPKKEKSAPRTIRQEVSLFVHRIDALAETLPLTMLAVGEAAKLSAREFKTFLTDHCRKVNEEGKSVSYSVPPEKQQVCRRLVSRLHKNSLATSLVPHSLFVALVSQFDAFLGRLIRHLFILKPEILNSSAHSIVFSELISFLSIEQARDYVIEKEIETVLRKSHAEQFDWLENKFGLPLRVGLPAWKPFIELTERRNLFVHADGIVSRQYVEVCKKHSCNLEPGIQQGSCLEVSKKYFEGAHDCILEIGVKLAQVLWRKVCPDQIGDADAALTTTIYDLLSEERYPLARVLSDFAAETLPRHQSEEHRLTMVVNRAQAYKWSGDEETARKIIAAEDWTAFHPKFRLAKAVLLDNFAVAMKLMKEMGSNGEMEKNCYREWPLFREIRKVADFQKAFEEIFGEPLNTVTVEAASMLASTPSQVN